MALQNQPSPGDYGAFLPNAWQNSFTTFTGLGTIKGTGHAGDAYTSQFISACNNFDKAAVVKAAEAYPTP